MPNPSDFSKALNTNISTPHFSAANSSVNDYLSKGLGSSFNFSGSSIYTTQQPSTFSNINGAIGAGADFIGAVGNTLGAYWSYKNGKAQTKAMQQQVDLMDKQMQIENERYNKRESERLENAAEFQKQGESFSQGIQKSNNDLPTNRI